MGNKPWRSVVYKRGSVKAEMQLFFEETKAEFPKLQIDCRCGWRGDVKGLDHKLVEEQYHPLNRQGRMSIPFHQTRVQACPRCSRWLYADGYPTNSLKVRNS